MKKILTSTLLFGLIAFTSLTYAQQVNKNQRAAIQTDNVETFKKAFTKAEYDKCMSVKELSTTMLAYSIKYQKNNIANFLMNNNSDVNKACDGVTPLMTAAKYGNMDAAKNLLKRGANKNAKDNNGKTAKDYAVEHKQSAMTMIL
ncbi:ankyrin repeat domain-containing protein [Chryseobacterium echinoideorum]|uniref:ankyrin repeat domain-containing protein n=1 Tax=Chryseobacterium echinoideorum TaxID=1549648 RepID=UPI001184C21C|nr:ankyrin repeat domain-containing protein [Chryseobacterium echinoideorum]